MVGGEGAVRVMEGVRRLEGIKEAQELLFPELCVSRFFSHLSVSKHLPREVLQGERFCLGLHCCYYFIVLHVKLSTVNLAVIIYNCNK